MANIFISHSCKDLEKVEEHDPRKPALRFARQVREAFVKAVGNTHETLLDVEHLKGGDDWCAKLHEWLGSCDGAVILINAESANSDWIKKEATILTWRQSQQKDLRIVPAFLGDFSANDLTTCGFGASGIERLQAVQLPPSERELTQANATKMGNLLADRFVGLSSNTCDTPLDKWVTRVAIRLNSRNPQQKEILKGVARSLGATDQDLQCDEHTFVRRFAHHLLHQTPKAIVNAMLEIQRAEISRDDLRGLTQLLRPLWVPLDLAGNLAELSNSRSIVATTAESTDTVEQFLRRAKHQELAAAEFIPLKAAVGLGQTESIDHMRDVISTRFRQNTREDEVLIQILSLSLTKYFLLAGIELEPSVVEWLAKLGDYTSVVAAGRDFRFSPQSSVARVTKKLTSDENIWSSSFRIELDRIADEA